MQLRIILYRRTPEFTLRPLHVPLRAPWPWFSSLFNITTLMRSSIHHLSNNNDQLLHATKPQKYQQYNPKTPKYTFTKNMITITPTRASRLDHKPPLMI